MRRFLLHGKPSGIFVPRQRAVRALAQLGAKQVLLEYLASETDITDPVVAHGEEAAKNTAARAHLDTSLPLIEEEIKRRQSAPDDE